MKHITDQNWFAVGLDVVVVIVGIFLGLQVQAFYDERGDKNLERQYLLRLLNDTELSIGLIKVDLDAFDQLIMEQNVMLNAIQTGELSNENGQIFKDGLPGLMGFTTVRRKDSTIEELKSSGSFALITNVELRNALSQWIESTRYVTLQVNYFRIFSVSINENIAEHLLVGHDTAVEINNYDDLNKSLSMLVDIEQLKGNLKLQSELSRLIHNKLRARQWFGDYFVETELLGELIKAELAKFDGYNT